MTETTTEQHAPRPGWVPGDRDLAERLSLTLRLTDIGVSQMATYLGVTRETIGRWINGRVEPKRAALLAWAGITGADMAWLETGQSSPDSVRADGVLPRLGSNQQPPRYPLALGTGGVAGWTTGGPGGLVGTGAAGGAPPRPTPTPGRPAPSPATPCLPR